VEINETPVPTGWDMHHNTQNNREQDNEGVPEEQAGASITEYQLPDMLVRIMGIPEIIVVNTSMAHRVISKG
jgi:hypothetical protein